MCLIFKLPVHNLILDFRIQALREELLRGNYDIVLLQVSKCFHIFMDTQCFGPGVPQSTCRPRTNLMLIKFMIQARGIYLVFQF